MSPVREVDWNVLSDRGAWILRTVALPASIGYERKVIARLRVLVRPVTRIRDPSGPLHKVLPHGGSYAESSLLRNRP
jgi:hypothetical protein